MDYLDFEIEIGLGAGRDYPVSVRTPEGDARQTMRFPFGAAVGFGQRKVHPFASPGLLP